MHKLILIALLVGLLSTTFCGPVGQPGGLDQGNTAEHLAIITAKLAPGIVGRYYTAHLKATGGAPPYHWAVMGGALPAGLVLDSATGEVSGTPTQFTKSALMLLVDDSNLAKRQESTATLVLAVDPDCLTIVTPSLPQAIIGMPYSVTLEAAGGTLPYTWSIAQGSLPPGLDLDPLSGVIQGKPSQAGTSVFIIQATDSSSPPMSVAYRLPPQSEAEISAR